MHVFLNEIIGDDSKYCEIVVVNKERRQLLKTILNRRYKSKGNRSKEQIIEDLIKADFLPRQFNLI